MSKPRLAIEYEAKNEYHDWEIAYKNILIQKTQKK